MTYNIEGLRVTDLHIGDLFAADRLPGVVLRFEGGGFDWRAVVVSDVEMALTPGEEVDLLDDDDLVRRVYQSCPHDVLAMCHHLLAQVHRHLEELRGLEGANLDQLRDIAAQHTDLGEALSYYTFSNNRPC